MSRALLARVELLHDDVIADATALAALLPADARRWRPHPGAASVADVFTLLDAATAHAADRPAPGRAACWAATLSAALDPLRLRGPWPRAAGGPDAPERFLARQARVRDRVDALRRAAAVAPPARGEPPAGVPPAVRALALLVARQRRLVDAALRIAERGGHLAESTAPEEPLLLAQAVAPRSAS